MTPQVKVTAIIVSYNEKEFISKAIESCLRQKFDSYEILIGDDGSDDGSIAIIENYVRKYPDIIRYFIQERNIGPEGIIPSVRVSNVLRKAFDMARGKYITCLSADDFFCDSFKFKTQSSFLDRHNGYSAIASRYVYVNQRRRVTPNEKYMSLPPFLFWAYGYRHISSYMFRKSVTSSEYMQDSFFDDTGMSYAILAMGKVYQQNRISFAYRQREMSIMHSSDSFELNLLEVLMIEKTIVKKKFACSTIAKGCSCFHNVFDERKRLDNDKYRKYLINSEKGSFPILSYIKKYDTLPKIKKIEITLFLKLSSCIRFVMDVIKSISLSICRMFNH